MTDHSSPLLLTLALAALTASSADAQRGLAWRGASFAEHAAFPGIDGTVQCVTRWDPDGPGPLTERIVFGGDFTFAGTTRAANVVAYDPATATWTPFGNGTDSTVHALLAMPDGGLYVGGQFRDADGTDANAIAYWNGNGFEALGRGLTVTGLPFYFGAVVHALAATADGGVVVAGSFERAGTEQAACIARWHDGRWSSYGDGIPQLAVRDVQVLPDGGIVAAGDFTTAGGGITNGLARWNGDRWLPVSPTLTQPTAIEAIELLPNGELAVAGPFQQIGGLPAPGFALWDGAAWRTPTTGCGFVPTSLCVDERGGLLASGNGGIARWNGVAWSSVADAPGTSVTLFRSVLPLANGALVAAGQFASVGNCVAANTAHFDGATWLALDSGIDGTIATAVTTADGRVFAGGNFRRIADVTANHVAEWTGENWQALGAGTDGPITALAVRRDGDLIAAGTFATAGATAASRIARWDGSSWHPLAGGLSSSVGSATVHTLAELADGSLIAAGSFQHAGGALCNGIARFRDGTWTALGLSPNSVVTACAVTATGDLLVAGKLGWSGQPSADRVARWRDGGWSPIGASFAGAVLALAQRADGRLVAGGSFVDVGGVAAARLAHFQDGAWRQLAAGADGTVHALLPLPDGDLLLGGTFAHVGGVATNGIARLRAHDVTAFGSGVADGAVRALCWRPSGDVLVAGSFRFAGGQARVGIARLATDTPALTEIVSAGQPTTQLTAERPWLGTSWRSRVDVPCDRAVLAYVTGTALHPAPAVAPRTGGTLIVRSDLVAFAIADAGPRIAATDIPDAPALLGQRFHHQVLVAEIGADGALLGVRASNALSLTIGAF